MRSIWKERLGIYLKGVAMGIADIIPGVSGATIALIVGIYERFIGSLSAIEFDFFKLFFKGRFQEGFAGLRELDFALFIPLGLGIGTSLVGLSHLVSYLLEHYALEMGAFFVGLILMSAIVIGKKETKFTFESAFFMVVGVGVALFIASLHVVSLNLGVWFLFVSGAIAICAMLLPGISGSFVLLLMGQYTRVLEAVKTVDFVSLIVFAFGALCGLLGFSRVINWVLARYRRVVLSFLIGLMLGSVRVFSSSLSALGKSSVLLSFLFGLALVFGLARVSC